MTRKFLYEYVEAEQRAQRAIKEKERKMVMTERDEILKREGFEEISEKEQLQNMRRHSSIISWETIRGKK